MPTAMPNTAAVTPVMVSGSEKSKLMPACTRRLLAVCFLEGRWLLHLKAGNCLPLSERAVRQEGVTSVDCILRATLCYAQLCHKQLFADVTLITSEVKCR